MLNLLLQLKRYDACCPLYKEMCAFELKYKHEQQIYVDFIKLLGLKKTAAVVQRLTHSQLMKIVLAWQKMTLQSVVEQEQASDSCVRTIICIYGDFVFSVHSPALNDVLLSGRSHPLFIQTATTQGCAPDVRALRLRRERNEHVQKMPAVPQRVSHTTACQCINS